MKRIGKVIWNIGLILLLVLGLNNPILAYHHMGGEISWKSTGTPNIYEVTCLLYHQCIATGMTYPCGGANSLNLYVYGYDGVYMGQRFGEVSVPIDNSVGVKDGNQTCNSIQSVCDNCGTRTPGTYAPGMETITYRGLVNLSNVPSSCCKVMLGIGGHYSLSDVVNVNPIHGPHRYTIINRCIGSPNQTPIIQSQPTFIVCSSEDVTYSLNAFDVEGDSLVYEFADIKGHPFGASLFISPFTIEKPIPYFGFPINSPPALPPLGISLNRSTGLLRFRPASSYRAVLNIEIKEYRKIGNNYELISTTPRICNIISQVCGYNLQPKFRSYDSLGVLTGIEAKTNYTLEANKGLCFQMSAIDFHFSHDTTDIEWKIPNNLLADGLTITKLYNQNTRKINGPKYDSIQICWNPSINKINSRPYYISLLAKDANCPIQGKTQTVIGLQVVEGPVQLKNLAPLQVTFSGATLGGQVLFTGGSSIQIKGIVYSTTPNPTRFGNQCVDVPLSVLLNPFSQRVNGLQAGTKYYFRAYAGPMNNPFYANQDSFVTLSVLGNPNLPDTLIVFKEDSALLDGGTGYASYEWNQTPSTRTIWAKTSGWFRLKVIEPNYTEWRDSTYVCFIKGIQEKGMSLCSGASLNLHTLVSPNVSLKWWNLDTNYQTSSTVNGTIYASCNYSFGSFKLRDSILINVRPLPSNQVWVNRNRICTSNPDSLSLLALGGNAFYHWFKNNQLVQIGPNQTLMVSEPGIYHFIITDSFGCANNSPVISINPAPNIHANLHLHSSNRQCLQNNKITLVDSSTYIEPYERIWDFGDGLKDSMLQTEHFYSNAGKYVVKLRVDNGLGCYDFDSTELVILPDPILPIVTGPETGLRLLTNYVYAVNGNPINTYHWTANKGNIMNTMPNDTAIVQWHTAGSGSITIRVTDSNNCYKDGAPKLVSILNTGLETSSEKNPFLILPNPNQGSFWVQVSASIQGNCEFGVYTISGACLLKETKELKGNSDKIPFDLKLAPGIYIMKLNKGDQVLTQTFIVQ